MTRKKTKVSKYNGYCLREIKNKQTRKHFKNKHEVKEKTGFERK